MNIVYAFASPNGSEATDVSNAVAQKYFEQAQRRVLSLLAGGLPNSLIRGLETMAVSPATAWRPEMGMAIAACNAGNATLAAFQLVILTAPLEIECSGQVGAGSLLLDGWLIPVHGEVSIRASSGILHISSASGVALFAIKDGRWNLSEEAVDRDWVVYSALSGRPRYIVDSGIPGSSRMFPQLGGKGPHALQGGTRSRKDVANTINTLNVALQSINDSKGYGEWMSSAVDGLILTTGDVSVGVSSPNFPGLVALNLKGSALEYAETIISAVCYQKLFQLAMLYALTEPGTEEIHYIPERRSYTTTRRALAAAHEHVNAIVMLKSFNAETMDMDLVRSRIRKRALMLSTDCVPALEKSSILTIAGKNLWSRLCDLSFNDTFLEGSDTPVDSNNVSERKRVETALDCGLDKESATSQILVAGSAT